MSRRFCRSHGHANYRHSFHYIEQSRCQERPHAYRYCGFNRLATLILLLLPLGMPCSILQYNTAFFSFGSAGLQEPTPRLPHSLTHSTQSSYHREDDFDFRGFDRAASPFLAPRSLVPLCLKFPRSLGCLVPRSSPPRLA